MMTSVDFEQRVRELDDITAMMTVVQRQHSETLRDLKDSLIVVADIQRRQAAVQREQAEMMDRLAEMLARQVEILAKHAEDNELHRKRMALFDEKMLEIEERLDALIRVVDGMQRNQPRPPSA